MKIDTKKYKKGRWDMLIIREEPIPDRDSLEWDSSSDGDDIPLTEDCHKPDAPLWWTIIIDDVYTNEHFENMIIWCEENVNYMCGMRLNEYDNFVVGYFRHPDDALAFKWSWI